MKHNTGKNRAHRILWGGSKSAEHVTPPTYNPNYPPPTRYSGNQDTAAMLDCICQLQLTVQ